MDDLECAQTLVAMRTKSIEEMSKDDRLAAIILSVMRDYGVADPAAAPKTPPAAAQATGKPRRSKRQNATRGPPAIEPLALPSPPTTSASASASPTTASPATASSATASPATASSAITSPATTATASSSSDSETSPRLPVSPVSSSASSGPSRPAKRTRANEGPHTNSSRKRFKLGEEGGKTKSRGEQIGACLKAVFNQWETTVDQATGEQVAKDATTVLAEGIYSDAHALLPPDGPGSPHHDEEIAMAADAGFTEAKGNLADYYVRKYRTALGFVFLTEHNLRLRAASEKPNLIEFNKTQAQMFPRGDVNVTSRWFAKWRSWGWFPDMKVDKDLNPELETKFSEDLRARLIDQAIKYEDAHCDCKQWKHYPAIARV
ncbi:hypothetical protein DV738_g2922, partial [Chaetothyriales sp. CBS 135597]